MEPADLDIADLDQALLLIPSEAAKEIRAFCASLEKLQPDQRIKRCEQKRDNLLTCYAELEASLICYQLVFERYLCPGNSWPQFGAVVQAREISKRLKSLIGVSKIWGRNVVTHYGFVSQSRGYCDELRAFAKMVPVWEKAVAILNRSIYQRTNRTDKRTPAVKEAVNPIERWDLQYSKRYIGTANRQERAIPSVPLRYGLDQYGLIVFESFASRPPLVSSLSPHAPGHHTTPESDDCSIQPPSPSKPASIASGITAHTLSLPASAQSSPTKSTGIMNTINATGEDTTIPLELLTTISRSLSNGSSPLSSMPSNSPASSVSTSTCGQQPSTGADNGHLKRKRVPSQIDDHTSSKRGCEDNMLMDDAGNHRNCVVTSLAMTHSVPFRSAVPFPAQSVTNTSTSTANEKLLPPKWRRANLSKEDIRTLDNDNWLNDNVIMFYLHFLHTSTAQMSVHHIYIQESYFFAKLKTESSKPFRYKTMATWTKGDIFSYEYIVVPICEKSHWYMAIIYQPGKLLAQETMDLETKIITLDSLGKAHPQTCSILQEYLIYERERRLRSCGQKASGLLGSLCITADVPRQDNHNDCGIFLLEYFRIFLSDPGEFIVKILSKEAMHWPIRPMKLRKDICDVIMNLQPELRSRIGRTNGESPRAITEDSFDLDVERDLGAQLADYAIAAGSPEARLLTAFSKLPSEDVMIIKQIDLQMLVTVLHVALKRVYHSQLLQVPPEQAGLVSAEASGTDLVSFQKRTEDKTNRESSDTMGMVAILPYMTGLIR
ncbi:hypothetical protein F5Y17DRAFT_196095 [Xylariaceae sp. FL0594]|nr:hypothetical protein F5Y17DRAFT_196095 [Xylariaceae sp. FL0594]